jgi:hypothetical protein
MLDAADGGAKSHHAACTGTIKSDKEFWPHGCIPQYPTMEGPSRNRTGTADRLSVSMKAARTGLISCLEGGISAP